MSAVFTCVVERVNVQLRLPRNSLIVVHTAIPGRKKTTTYLLNATKCSEYRASAAAFDGLAFFSRACAVKETKWFGLLAFFLSLLLLQYAWIDFNEQLPTLKRFLGC